MGGERFPEDELRAIESALAAYETRCAEISRLIGDKRWLSAHELEHVRSLYAVLKADIRQAAHVPTLDQRKRALTRAEQCFWDPAIRRAAVDLRPATNTNPIRSNWIGALVEARSEFSYWRHNLQSAGSGSL